MVRQLLGNALTVVLVYSLLICPSVAEQASNLLDGKAFVGNNGEKGRPLDPDEHEEIVFRDGTFTSLSCAPYNFSSSNYRAQRIGDSIHFSATTHSPTHGQIAWQGVVNGEQAEMSFVWTKQRWYWDIHREYWFQGTLKK